VKLPGVLKNVARIPKVTRARIILALTIAVAADAVQLLLGPFGWMFADQVIDLATMGLMTALLGFHVLLLPSFILELVPLVQELPTWTACVLAVIALRKRRQRAVEPAGDPAIDI
jgi:hypothetical protein